MKLTPFFFGIDKCLTLSASLAVACFDSGLGFGRAEQPFPLRLRRCLATVRVRPIHGNAGCFDRKIPLGTVVAVKKETIADQSVIELKKLKTLFDLKLVPHDEFPFSNGWLENNNQVLKKLKLKKVNGISVNEITTSRQRVRFYEESFQPAIESMEGAALHYTCLMEKIPFIQLRSISNYIAERDKTKWDMKKSIVNLNEALIHLVETIS